MTIFEKAQSKLRSLIWRHECGMYLDKCIIKFYKRLCKKYPTSVPYHLNLQSCKSSYRQHRDTLKDLSEMQELLNE